MKAWLRVLCDARSYCMFAAFFAAWVVPAAARSAAPALQEAATPTGLATVSAPTGLLAAPARALTLGGVSNDTCASAERIQIGRAHV